VPSPSTCSSGRTGAVGLIPSGPVRLVLHDDFLHSLWHVRRGLTISGRRFNQNGFF
jgi:hypothetical protein